MSVTDGSHDGLTAEIRRLPPLQAAALGCVYALGLTQAEAAHRLNIARADVAAQLAAGLLTLGQHILDQSEFMQAG